MPQDATLSPSTVDAFTAAPEDKQREALGKMSAPAKTALLTALKARKTATPAAPTTPATPTSPANPLVTSGEGQYQMRGKDGKTVLVSYSHVLDSIHNGYNFVDRPNLAQFARDHAADPNNAEHRSDATVKAMSNWDPRKYLAAIGAGVNDPIIGAGGEVLKAVTAFDKPSHSEFETNLQLAAETPAENPMQKVGEVGEQVGELFAAPETDLAKAAKVPKLAKTALTVVEQGLRAAGEQGGQTFIHTGGDTGEAKTAAEAGGVLGALSPLAAPVLEKVGKFAGDVERFFNGVSDIHTGKIVRAQMRANEEIAQKAEVIKAENAQKVADADKAHAQKVADSKAKYDEAVAGRTNAEDKAKLKQQQVEDQSRIDHEHEVEKARLAHEAEVARQAQQEAQAAVARRTELELRGRLAARMQTIRDAAQAYFKKNYADVEGIVNRVDPQVSEIVGKLNSGADPAALAREYNLPVDTIKEYKNPGYGAQLDESNTVPISDLADAVSDARKHIEGSDESIKVFNDITKKIQGVGKAEKASGLGPEELSSLAPDELEALHKEGGAPQSVGFSDLKGYYSELGRLLSSESVPGDVKQAVVALRDSIDEMQQKLANDAGVGTRYKLLRNQYKNYAQGFLDYQGPKGEASAVAQAVRKNDAFNATKAFPKMEPEELSHIKQILAGKPTADYQFVEGDILTQGGKSEPAWRYRKDSSRLMDDYIKASKKAHDLDEAVRNTAKRKPAGEFVPPEYKPPKTPAPKEQKPIGEFKPPEQKPVPQKKVPQPTVMTPEKLRELKVDALNKSATIVNRFGVYMVAGGLIGGITQLVRTGDPVKAASGAGEGMLVGIGGGAVAPYLLARLVDREDVIRSLSTVTEKDLLRLAKMPAPERAEVSEALRQLAETAQAKGKLAKPSPWLRILGGTAASKTANALSSNPSESSPGESEQDIQKDLDQMQNQVTQ